MASNSLKEPSEQDIQSSLLELKRVHEEQEAKRRNLIEELPKKAKKLEAEQERAKRREVQVQSGQYQLRVITEGNTKIAAEVNDQRLKQSSLIDAVAAVDRSIEEMTRSIQKLQAKVEAERKTKEAHIQKVETSEAESSIVVELTKLRAINAELKKIEKDMETEGSLAFEIASGTAILRVQQEKEEFLNSLTAIKEGNDKLRSRLHHLQLEEAKLLDDRKVLENLVKVELDGLQEELKRMDNEEQELKNRLQVLEAGCKVENEITDALDGLDDDLEWGDDFKMDE